MNGRSIGVMKTYAAYAENNGIRLRPLFKAQNTQTDTPRMKENEQFNFKNEK